MTTDPFLFIHRDRTFEGILPLYFDQARYINPGLIISFEGNMPIKLKTVIVKWCYAFAFKSSMKSKKKLFVGKDINLQHDYILLHF